MIQFNSFQNKSRITLGHVILHVIQTLLGAASSMDPSSIDIDENDEDQMLRAIAMSLGENAVMSTDQVSYFKVASCFNISS